MKKQARSSKREAAALDDLGHSDPPGLHRLPLRAAPPSPTPHLVRAPRWRPPAPCREGWCLRFATRSGARRLHLSRPGCAGHHRVRRPRFARARRCGLHARTCRIPGPPCECPTPRGHLDTTRPTSSGLHARIERAQMRLALNEMRLSAAYRPWPGASGLRGQGVARYETSGRPVGGVVVPSSSDAKGGRTGRFFNESPAEPCTRRGSLVSARRVRKCCGCPHWPASLRRVARRLTLSCAAPGEALGSA